MRKQKPRCCRRLGCNVMIATCAPHCDRKDADFGNRHWWGFTIFPGEWRLNHHWMESFTGYGFWLMKEGDTVLKIRIWQGWHSKPTVLAERHTVDKLGTWSQARIDANIDLEARARGLAGGGRSVGPGQFLFWRRKPRHLLTDRRHLCLAHAQASALSRWQKQTRLLLSSICLTVVRSTCDIERLQVFKSRKTT
jgi:hypothetical protein